MREETVTGLLEELEREELISRGKKEIRIEKRKKQKAERGKRPIPECHQRSEYTEETVCFRW